jgi:hypothetical protein
LSTALEPWRKPRAVHDPGKILLDLSLSVALGGGCLSDVGVLRAEPSVFGLVASHPTVSRLVDVLAVAGPRALIAIRRAGSEVRKQVWKLAGKAVPDTGRKVIVDVDGVLVLAHSEKQDAAATWKKTFGQHPLVAFVDHGPDGSGEPVAGLLRPGNAGSNTASDHITVTRQALAQLPKRYRRGRRTLIRRLRRWHPRVPGLAHPARAVAVLLGRNDDHRRRSPGRWASPGVSLDTGRGI